MQLRAEQIAAFRETVWLHYRTHHRAMPWRVDPSPYHVLVSELMLQQTQVSRVIPKYEAFMRTCTNITQLADASLADVLTLWSGLGYNRRAKFLHQTAQIVAHQYAGELPSTQKQLEALPGIGPNTAGAILAYAFEQPVIFVETNIRTVLFHHFFSDSIDRVDDKEVRDIMRQVVDTENPREWYWALMDYGTYLKKTVGARLTMSKHYVKQAPLEGSLRQMRGMIIKRLVGAPPLPRAELHGLFHDDDRFNKALISLVSDGLVVERGDHISLTDAGQTS